MGSAKRFVWILTLFAVCFTLMACATKQLPVKDVTDQPELLPPDMETRPDGVAREFLDYIKDEKFKEAYQLLSVDAQLRVSEQKFVSGLSQVMKTESTKRSFLSRTIASERIVDGRAIVTVKDAAFDQSKLWTWEFEETLAGWKISSLDLPPVCSYKPSN